MACCAYAPPTMRKSRISPALLEADATSWVEGCCMSMPAVVFVGIIIMMMIMVAELWFAIHVVGWQRVYTPLTLDPY